MTESALLDGSIVGPPTSPLIFHVPILHLPLYHFYLSSSYLASPPPSMTINVKPASLTNLLPSDVTLMMRPMDPGLIHSRRFTRSIVPEPAEAIPTELARPSFADGVACCFGMVLVLRFWFAVVAFAVLWKERC